MPSSGCTAATRLTPPLVVSPISTTRRTPGCWRTAIARSRRSPGSTPSTRSTTTPSDARPAISRRPPGRELRPHLLELGLQRLDLVELALHPVDDVAGGADELGDLGELPLVALQQLDRRGAGDRLDAAQVGADRRLADHLERADVAGRA